MVDENEITGLFCPTATIVGNSILLEMEPLHVSKTGAGSFLLMGWADAKMRVLAEAHGLKFYSFTVLNSNARFQRIIEKYFPVTFINKENSKQYFRIL